MEREFTVHAIVLRRRDAGDSDRRLTLLTREQGVIDAYARGARKAGSRLAGCSEPLSASILQLAKGKVNLFIKQSQPVTSFAKLRSDYDRLSAGLAIAELYSLAIPRGQDSEELFSSLVAALRYLEVHENPIVAFVWAAIRLMDEAGFMPQLTACVVTGDPISEVMPFISPNAGGYVSGRIAGSYPDAYRTRVEVIYGLVKLAELERPPVHLKFVNETLDALHAHWLGIAERKLLSFESLVQSVMLQRQSEEEVARTKGFEPPTLSSED